MKRANGFEVKKKNKELRREKKGGLGKGVKGDNRKLREKE